MIGTLIPSLIIASLAGFGFWLAARATSKAAKEYRLRFQYMADRNLSAMFMFLDPQKLFFLNIVIIIATFLILLLLTHRATVAIIPALALGFSPTIVFKVMHHFRRNQIVDSMPDTLMSMSSNMRSGLSLSQAIETTVAFEKGPLSQELSLLLSELRIGMGFEQAMDNFHMRIPRVEIQLFVAAMKIARETGGNLAETLERISSTLRSKLQMEGKIKSLTAQGRLQGFVMTGLPIGLGAILFQMQPKAMSFMFTEWYGWACIGVILTLEAIGFFFIWKIVSIDV